MPSELGEPVWTFQWRERSDAGDRTFATLISTITVGGGAAYGLSRLVGTSAPVIALSFVLFAVAAWIFFGPDRHCYVAGKLGASISRQRFGCWTTREVMLYAEADDVELESTRVVSDAVSQIYMHTDVTFSFVDKEGYEVFAIPGRVDEPEQRADTKYNPTAPLQLDGTYDCGADFGFAAMEAFHAFKDQRPGGVYR